MHWQQLHCVTIAQGQHFDGNDDNSDDDEIIINITYNLQIHFDGNDDIGDDDDDDDGDDDKRSRTTP